MIETDTHVYFYSGKEIYSNFYVTKFKDPISGVEFSSSEQAFMWQKAKFFGDDSVRLALEVFDILPREAKELGRQIANYDDKAWECVRVGFMIYVNLLKFGQNEDMKKQLLSTDRKVLVEASPHDKIWGVGLSETDAAILREDTWKGRNLLGLSLMKVRQILAQE